MVIIVTFYYSLKLWSHHCKTRCKIFTHMPQAVFCLMALSRLQWMANEYIKDTNSACNIDFYVGNKVLTKIKPTKQNQ